MSMTGENKFFIGVGVATLVLIIGGVFFFSKQSSNTQTAGSEQIDLVAGAKNTLGSPDSKIKIVEFGDYQCPACAAAHPIIKQVLDANKDKASFVFRNFPLPIHLNARDSAKAAEAAAEQGKFWEMHDLLYENQNEWSELGNAKDKFREYAQNLGLDMNKYDEDFDKVIERVNQDFALGERAGVESTPTFFINGVKYPGVIPADKFQQLMDEASK